MALMSVDDALNRLLDKTPTLECEMVSLAALGSRQVLAKDIIATLTQPPFRSSAMDGYAIAIKENQPQENQTKAEKFKIIGEAAAGKAFNGTIGQGEAIRIFTGAPVPADATCVIMQEKTTINTDGTLSLTEAPIFNSNIRPMGGDFSKGEVVLNKGTILSPASIALCAASGHATVPTIRRPKVAILATGDELVAPDAPRGDAQIICSNSYGLAQIIKNHDCEVIDLGIAKDEKDSIAAAIAKAKQSQADILVTIGGVSVGEYDLVQTALKAEGMALDFWKIAMRPGKPLMFGILPAPAPILVLGLPGNPVSSLVCAELFLIPILEKLSGRTYKPRLAQAILATDLPKNTIRRHYLRAKLQNENGKRIATPLNNQDSSLLSLYAHADCLIIQEIDSPAQKAGESCTIQILDHRRY